jgi:KaiC/GvpD/RAD55 family RecA-like ATPase
MRNFGWETSTYEQEGAFILVNCYSPTASLSSEEKHNVERPFALSDLGIAVSTAMSEVKHKSPRVFLDSTAPLFARVDASKVTEFLQDRSARIKSDNSAFFFTVGKGTIPSDLLNRLEEIVDCIIELNVHEEKGKTLRRMRIGKLRGRRVAHGWIPFKIGSKNGISFFPPGRREKPRKS